MTKDIRDVLKLALEALETELAVDWTNNDEFNLSAEKMHEAITAIKQALTQPEQEPVAWFSPSGNLYKTRFHATANGEQVVTPLYTTPPQTDEFKCPLCYDDIANIKNPSQPEQEPVNPAPCARHCEATAFQITIKNLKAELAQRTWAGLTDEEKSELWEISRAALPRYATYASLIETKLKEKNT